MLIMDSVFEDNFLRVLNFVKMIYLAVESKKILLQPLIYFSLNNVPSGIFFTGLQ